MTGSPSPRGSDPSPQETNVLYAAMGVFVAVVVAGVGALSQLHGYARFYVAALLAVVSAVVCFIAYATKLGRREALILSGAAAVVLIVSGGYAWTGWQEHDRSATRGEISSIITDAADAETAWYEHPSGNYTARLKNYYVGGGPGLQAIVQVAAHFRHEQCRWGRLAHEIINVQSVAINGRTATAQTIEFYHQPRVCTGPPPATHALGDRSQKVTYELVQTGAGWRILSSSTTYLS